MSIEHRHRDARDGVGPGDAAANGSALGLRMPRALSRTRAGRTTARIMLYALAVVVFVLPLWTLLATALSGGLARLGQVMVALQRLFERGLLSGSLKG